MTTTNGSGSRNAGIALLVFAVVAWSAGSARGETRTWIGGESGSFGAAAWTNTANWNTGVPPDADNAAFIGNATGNRDITTHVTATYLRGMSMIQSSSAVNKLVLGTNVLTKNYFTENVFTNTSGDASNLVIDLNGHTFKRTLGLPGQMPSMQILSSTPGGRFVEYSANTSAGTYVGSGVTFQVEGGNFNINGATFDPDSTVLRARDGSPNETNLRNGPGTLGNLHIGGNSIAGQSLYLISSLFVQGDLLVAEATDALKVKNYIVKVKGNYTDNSTATVGWNGSGKLYFYGNAPSNDTPSVVNMAHAMLTTDLVIGDGDDGLTSANVQLACDISTAGTVILQTSSRVDIGTNTLTHTGDYLYFGSHNTNGVKESANAPGKGDDITLAFTVGADNDSSGRFVSDNDLRFESLRKLTIELSGGDGWTGGDDLILMTGPPDSYPTRLTDEYEIVAPEGWTWGDLVADTVNDEVRLENLVVPLPASGTLIIIQ